jgi:hypothetical protein
MVLHNNRSLGDTLGLLGRPGKRTCNHQRLGGSTQTQSYCVRTRVRGLEATVGNRAITRPGGTYVLPISITLRLMVSCPRQFRSKWQEKEKIYAQKNAELRKAEEALLRSKKDLERQTSKLKVSTPGNASQREAELQVEVDKAMVCPHL